MKTLLTLLLVALALAGCATNDYAQYSKAQTDIATARHAADAAKYRAMSDIAASGDSSAKVAALMAIAMGQSSGAQSTIQAPQARQALQWASILVPGLTQVVGMRYNFLSQQSASNNSARVAESTNATFLGLAGKIQAPAANIYTTTTSNTDRHDAMTTLSGTGTLGSGAYIITDRNDTVTTTQAPTVVTPVVQIVPTVITPITPTVPVIVVPDTQITPVVVVPDSPIVPVVVTPANSTP